MFLDPVRKIVYKWDLGGLSERRTAQPFTNEITECL